MLVLSRTVLAKNSLLITVVDEMFSFVKIAGKLYKSCMCLILSQSRRCLYIALSFHFIYYCNQQTNIIDDMI